MLTIQCENPEALLASCGNRNIPAREKYKVREKRFLCLHEFLFPFPSCQKVGTIRRACEVHRGRLLWSPVEFWSVSFGRSIILCLLTNTNYIIKVLNVLNSSLDSLNENKFIATPVSTITCFCTWNSNPGFIQKEEEIEQSLGEMNVIMVQRSNKLWCTILHTISNSLLLYPIFYLQWLYFSLIKHVANVGAKPITTHQSFDLLKTVFPSWKSISFFDIKVSQTARKLWSWKRHLAHSK